MLFSKKRNFNKIVKSSGPKGKKFLTLKKLSMILPNLCKPDIKMIRIFLIYLLELTYQRQNFIHLIRIIITSFLIWPTAGLNANMRYLLVNCNYNRTFSVCAIHWISFFSPPFNFHYFCQDPSKNLLSSFWAER